MESYLDKFFRKVVRKINPLWYLHYCWIKSYTNERVENYIQQQYPNEDDANKKAIKKMMKKIWIWRGVHHSDFYEMSLDKKSESERNKFVPRWEEVDLYFQVNDQRYLGILANKWNCYKHFEKFYKRQVVSVSKKDVMRKNINPDVVDFLNKFDKYIIKPLGLQGGKGIRMVERKADVEPKSLLLEYLKLPEFSNGVVMEELIVQDNRMAALHPESVNTIRITTVNFGDSVVIKWPVLRMGRGHSVVDNACSGGVFAALDENNGTIIRVADKQRGSYYTTHPDTHISLMGFQVPLWNELCESVKKIASSCPDCHIMGWDMALTDKGWVVVECNYGPCIVIQWALCRGVRDEFEEIRKRLHAKKGNSYLYKTLEPYLSVPLNP